MRLTVAGAVISKKFWEMIAMDSEAIIEAFLKLTGMIGWSVKRGHGTYITIEFGDPHLVVREPKNAINQDSFLIDIFRRRHVVTAGDWSLWIRDARWSISAFDRRANSGSDDAAIDEVLRDLDGQKVSEVKFSTALMIEFDLGGKLELGFSVFPNDPSSFLWTLSQYEGQNVSMQNDGRLVVGPPSSS